MENIVNLMSAFAALSQKHSAITYLATPDVLEGLSKAESSPDTEMAFFLLSSKADSAKGEKHLYVVHLPTKQIHYFFLGDWDRTESLTADEIQHLTELETDLRERGYNLVPSVNFLHMNSQELADYKAQNQILNAGLYWGLFFFESRLRNHISVTDESIMEALMTQRCTSPGDLVAFLDKYRKSLQTQINTKFAIPKATLEEVIQEMNYTL